MSYTYNLKSEEKLNVFENNWSLEYCRIRWIDMAELGSNRRDKSTKSQVDHVRAKSGDANSKIGIDVKNCKIMII